ncbi:MAG: DNA replication/repair protein RecF, partial [Nitrososphaera sp.]
MRLTKLRVHHLRCLHEMELTPGSGANWLVGPNGTGKTSLLEAIYLLSHGHSFRSGGFHALMQRGMDAFAIHAEVHSLGGVHALGMGRSDDGWRLRVDGDNVSTLSALLRRCAVICFEPGSHALIAGPADERRRFLDWGVFHVEHDFLSHWRAYRRALRQRNALLRSGGAFQQLGVWEAELDRLATPIERLRRGYIEALQSHLRQVAQKFLPELGFVHLHYQPGWDTQQPLSAVLAAQRERDFLQGHTRAGPHRADWKLVFEGAPMREYLSRGQTKLAVLACILAQGRLFAEHAKEWPILCLDDLASELDELHQRLVLEEVGDCGAQTWFTATRIPDWAISPLDAVFHVEHELARFESG